MTINDAKGITIRFVLLITVPFCIGQGCSVTPNPSDTDGDGVADEFDNCPEVSNADQLDTNHNGIGNACDVCSDNGHPTDGLVVSATARELYASAALRLSDDSVSQIVTGCTANWLIDDRLSIVDSTFTNLETGGSITATWLGIATMHGTVERVAAGGQHVELTDHPTWEWNVHHDDHNRAALWQPDQAVVVVEPFIVTQNDGIKLVRKLDGEIIRITNITVP